MSSKSKIVMILEAKGASKTAAAVDKVDGSVRKFGRNAKKSGDRVAAGWRRLGGAAKVGAAGAALLAGKIGGDVLAEYREAYKVGKLTNNVIETTGGAANVTADHVGNLSQAISNKVGIDDEEIQRGSNLLLTFKNVRNELGKNNAVFDRATAAAVDLSASGFGSIDGASKMLGKALNDPIKGISALGRAGVTFSDAQKKQIKTMVETGDVLGAQKMIMKEVESQVKGSAEAQADPIDRLKVAWANLLEQVGNKVVPVFYKLIDFTIDRLIPALSKVAHWIKRNQEVIKPLLAVVMTMIAVWKVATAVQAVFNAVAAANPWVLLAVGIAALIMGVIYAYKKVEWFRKGVDAVIGFIKKHWKMLFVMITGPIGLAVLLIARNFRRIVGFVKSVLGFVKRHWKTILVVLTGPIGLAVLLIARNFRRIVGFAKALPGKVGRALSGLWDGLKNTFKSAINWIIRKWNSFELTIGPIKIPAAPDIPKVSVGTPNIPLLAEGGQVHGVGSRWISGEGGAPELGEVTSDGVKVTPLAGDSGGGPSAVIHLHVNMDGRKVGEGVKRVALRDLLAASPA